MTAPSATKALAWLDRQPLQKTCEQASLVALDPGTRSKQHAQNCTLASHCLQSTVDLIDSSIKSSALTFSARLCQIG
jgi:hypothetical protein